MASAAPWNDHDLKLLKELYGAQDASVDKLLVRTPEMIPLVRAYNKKAKVHRPRDEVAQQLITLRKAGSLEVEEGKRKMRAKIYAAADSVPTKRKVKRIPKPPAKAAS
jgi:aldehyde:ferredoxin oxidoreductase